MVGLRAGSLRRRAIFDAVVGGCRRAPVFLRGACWSHRQLQCRAVPRIESGRQWWHCDHDYTNSDQSQVAAYAVHDVTPAKMTFSVFNETDQVAVQPVLADLLGRSSPLFRPP
jgi:hypothetical protein